MSNVMGQLDQDFRAVWVSNSGAVAKGTKLSHLAAQQIGIFPADVDCAGAEPVSLTNPSFKTNKRLVIRQGIKPFQGASQPSISKSDNKARKSIEIEAGDIVDWYGFRGSNEELTEIVSIGYDGFDASKTLTGMMDAKLMRVNIRLSGEPIKKFFHTNFINHSILIDKKLCLGGCDCFDACGKVPCDLIADAIIAAVNKDSVFHTFKNGMFARLPLRQFIKARKVKKCDTAAVAPVLVEQKKWSISVPVSDNSVIAQLASANPTLSLFEDGDGIYSTWLPAASAAPANFTLSGFVQPLCDTCPSCPVATTAVDGVKTVQVTVACGAAAPVIAGAITTSLISSSLAGDTYLISVPAATTDVAIQAILDALPCSYGDIIGLAGKVCVTPATTYTWASCESCFTTSKEFKIVVPDANCTLGVSRLPELQAAYPDLVITDDVAGTCVHSYKTTITSSCESAENCGKLAQYEFTAPARFEGFAWEETYTIVTTPSCAALVATPPPCCVCGVVFETAMGDQKTNACTFGWDNYAPGDRKPVRIQVNIHSEDWSDNVCDVTNIYHTILQKPKMRTSISGRQVQELEREQMEYEGKQWNSNPFSNELSGFHVVADANSMYDQYTLVVRKSQYGSSHMLRDQGNTAYHFYVPQGAGKNLESYFNSLVLSANNKLSAVVL